MSTSTLIGQVRVLLDDAADALSPAHDVEKLRAARTQLDGPLRVAFAGRLKAGKSTLLNAIVGEPLAATDATECTKIVTWYISGPATRAWGHSRTGERFQLRFTRRGGATQIDLGEHHVADLDRLVVETPNSRLKQLNLIDTPGLASTTEGVSARTEAVLVADGPGVDAVLYLMRHVHAADVGFLQSFQDEQFAGTVPVNAIGVLSRADEVSGGHGNALDVARTIAHRYAADDRVRALVQTVVPVSGLLGLAAIGLREEQYGAFARLEQLPDSALLSTDRFLRANTDISVDQRTELLGGFGLFGIRYCVGLIRHGRAADATQLAGELQSACGLDELRALLVERFLGRAEVLKAEAALRTVEVALDGVPAENGDSLRRRIESIVAGAHVLREMRTLTALRTGTLELDDADQVHEAERLLGGEGFGARERLGLAFEAADNELRPTALVALQRWQRLGHNPFAGSGTRRVAEVVRRTCEGLL